MAKEPKEVYQLKITLKGIRPPVWRRIQVPAGYNFNELHFAIQDAMGWDSSHLHGFEITSPKNGLRELIGPPEDDMMGREILNEEKKKLSQYFGKGTEKAVYVYDYGDDWIHEIKLEKILPMEKGASYPVCIAGKRACPPEDAGGVYGYLHMLEVLADPRSEEYEDIAEWVGEDFDPERFSPAEVVFYDGRDRESFGIAGGHSEPFDDMGDEPEYLEADDYHDAAEFEGDEEEESLQALISLFTSDDTRSLLEKAESGDLKGLDKNMKMLVLTMKLNLEDLSLAMDVLSDPESDTDDQEDAVAVFLNVFAQTRAGIQIRDKNPIEAFKFHEAMSKKGLENKDILSVMADLHALSLEKADEEGSRNDYKARLTRMAKLTPKKMFKELEKEFSSE